MATTIQIGDLAVEVIQKEIKNLHLSVHPPMGRVSIAAPSHLSVGATRAFAIGRLAWIRQQQRKLQQQERETPREYLDRESHYVWGDLPPVGWTRVTAYAAAASCSLRIGGT